MTGEFDSALSDLESNLVSNLTSKLGLREVYNIYLRNICQGDYQNDNDASTAKLDTCVPYTTTADGTSSSILLPLAPSLSLHLLSRQIRQRGTNHASHPSGINNSTSSIQSYVVVGTTNISVPLLETLGPSLQSLEDTIAVVGTANIIFIIIGFVANALVVIVSLLAIFLTRSRWLVRGALLFSSIAPVTVLISALFVTIIGVVVVEFVNGLGAALTIHAETGSSAVAIAWVAWAFSLAAQLYWVLTWFVSYRRSSFVRLLRTPEEVGRWRATFAQLRRDWKNPRELNKGNNRDNVPAGPESPRALIGRTEK